MISNSKVFQERKSAMKLDANLLLPVLFKRLYEAEDGINIATYTNAMKEVERYGTTAISKQA